MASGSPVAGDNYTLECSAGGSGGTFQWLGPPDGRTPIGSSGLIMISSTSTTSQLQFRPLQQSHNGSYLCNVSVDGLALLSEPVDVSVNGTIIPDMVLTELCIAYHLFSLQLPLCQSRLLMVELLQLQEKIISSSVVYLELKTSTLPSLTGGVVVRYKLGPRAPSPSLHYDCLMLLIMHVQLPLLQVI